MPRRPRDYKPGLAYHVIARGVRRSDLFRQAADYRLFLALLRRALTASDHHLVAYSLMPNHIHLLVECGTASLSAMMHRLLLPYARAFNGIYGGTGHVFQDRHHARACLDDSYFRELMRYIHLNPVRAGLSSTPAEYPWSSLRAYEGAASSVPLAIARGLAPFGSPAAEARRTFRRFLRAPVPKDFRAELERLERLTVPRLLPEGGASGQPASPQTLWQLGRVVVEASHLTVDELRGVSERRRARTARRVLAHLAVRRCGFRQREVAKFLGRSDATVSRWLRDVQLRDVDQRLLAECQRRLEGVAKAWPIARPGRAAQR